MKLIFAQGNPGTQYVQTRHNVGWRVLDRLEATYSLSWTEKGRFNAAIAEALIAGEKVLFVKPTTFYNETGVSAHAICNFYQISLENVLVLHDDIAIPFGSIRIRNGGSPAGNNGIGSLNKHIGETYWRLRIGIGSPLRERMHDADFVLGKFSQDENEALNSDIIPECAVVVEAFLAGRLAPTSKQLLEKLVQ